MFSIAADPQLSEICENMRSWDLTPPTPSLQLSMCSIYPSILTPSRPFYAYWSSTNLPDIYIYFISMFGTATDPQFSEINENMSRWDIPWSVLPSFTFTRIHLSNHFSIFPALLRFWLHTHSFLTYIFTLSTYLVLLQTLSLKEFAKIWAAETHHHQQTPLKLPSGCIYPINLSSPFPYFAFVYMHTPFWYLYLPCLHVWCCYRPSVIRN